MRNGQGRPLWGALTLMSLTVTMGCTTLAEDPIYPFQHEVEKRLNGSAEENRKYAILLPLRVAMLDVKTDYAYRDQVLREIDRLNLAEALPLLEEGLAWKATYWEGQAKDYAARLWVRFKTGNLNEGERLLFLGSAFKPGFRLDVQAEARKELAKAGQKGKEALSTMLKSLEETFVSDKDLLIATQIGYMFSKDQTSVATPAELTGLSASSNPYVRFVCLVCYALRGDKRATELALGLLGTPDAKKVSIHTAVLYNLPYCPGGDQVFTKVLQDMRGEPLGNRRERAVQLTLSYILGAQHGPFATVSSELRAEVLAVARREEPRPSALAVGDELVALGLLRSNKELAEQLVAKWDAKEGKPKGQ